MADWTGPFHLPKFTDDKFEEQKAKYVAKHGYTITVPALDDIIHLKQFPPLTKEEYKLWTGKIPVAEIPDVEKSGKEIAEELLAGKRVVSTKRRPNAEEIKEYRKNAKNMIPPGRREEIRVEKQKRKKRYLAMLASPEPKIVRDAGAIMTSLDDLQDAVSTLACIGLITAAVVGGTTAAVLAGPLGWIVGAATLLQLINPYSRLKGPRGNPYTGRRPKKGLEKATDKNPFSKKARKRVAKNIKKFRPKVGNWIEALQVTDNIFGVGISIGPIMGYAQSVIAGEVRKMTGEKVARKFAGETESKLAAKAGRAMKSLAVCHSVRWKSDFEAEFYTFLAANLANQVLYPYMQDNNPFEKIDDLAELEVEANKITDLLWIEIFEEEGHTAEEYEIWPQNGERWITYGELQEKTASMAAENLRTFAERNKHSPLAFVAGQNAHDFALGMMETIEGPGQVEIEYSHIERAVLMILDNGWCYPDDITDAQVEKFEDWLYVHEYMDTQPSYRDIWRYAEVFCGFKWAKSPDEIR